MKYFTQNDFENLNHEPIKAAEYFKLAPVTQFLYGKLLGDVFGKKSKDEKAKKKYGPGTQQLSFLQNFGRALKI